VAWCVPVATLPFILTVCDGCQVAVRFLRYLLLRCDVTFVERCSRPTRVDVPGSGTDRSSPNGQVLDG
jgi:hypothetical protein